MITDFHPVPRILFPPYDTLSLITMLQEIPNSPFLHIMCSVVSRTKQAFKKKIGPLRLFCQYFDLKTAKCIGASKRR
jgi:hypothetical protein